MCARICTAQRMHSTTPTPADSPPSLSIPTPLFPEPASLLSPLSRRTAARGLSPEPPPTSSLISFAVLPSEPLSLSLSLSSARGGRNPDLSPLPLSVSLAWSKEECCLPVSPSLLPSSHRGRSLLLLSSLSECLPRNRSRRGRFGARIGKWRPDLCVDSHYICESSNPGASLCLQNARQE